MRILLEFCRITLLGVLIWAGPVSAQTIDGYAEKQRAILELIDIMGMSSLIQQLVDVSVNANLDGVRKKNPKLSDADIRIVGDVIRQVLQETSPGILAKFALIYERVFTLEEVRDLNAFYRSSTGRKSLQAMPQIMTESLAAGRAWAADSMPTILERVRSQTKQRGIDLEM